MQTMNNKTELKIARENLLASVRELKEINAKCRERNAAKKPEAPVPFFLLKQAD